MDLTLSVGCMAGGSIGLFQSCSRGRKVASWPSEAWETENRGIAHDETGLLLRNLNLNDHNMNIL